MKQPNILIISNNCLSQTNSNGRTMLNFLVGWPKEKLAQFYIQNSLPDFSVCRNFFRVTDGQALRAFLGKGMSGGVVKEETTNLHSGSIFGDRKHKRTALTMLLREMIWNSRRWYGSEVQSWLDDFAPQVVLLQAGDCGFMFRLAEEIAEQYGAKLVIYNSEAYYFKTFDYFRAKGLMHWVYPLFRREFCWQFRKTISKAACSIYICEQLKEDYDREFGLPSEVIYTATAQKTGVRERKEELQGFIVSYLGNFGIGRYEPLVEIATALQEISPSLYLDIYGKVPNDTVLQMFEGCPGIRYKGFISYEQVVEVMHSSDLLVHCENFSALYREDLKYAFSTKIADSLASGTCFMIYAPDELACTRYLAENEAAWVVTEQKAMREVLQILAENLEERERYLARAAAVVAQNHSAEKNAKRFQELLCQAWEMDE